MKIWIAALACIVVVVSAARADADDPPAVRALYLQALHAMSDLQQPPYVTYTMQGHGDGLRVGLDAPGQCNTLMSFGHGNDNWTLRHRTYDFMTEVVDTADARRYVKVDSRLLDPTWYGALHALRLGTFMPTVRDCATTPIPPPIVREVMPTPDPTLETIAVVAVLGPGIYSVEDRGSAPRPNGAPGHALHLRSRTKDWRHQLSDVVIDVQSSRFCVVRIKGRMGIPGVDAVDMTWEEHYGQVGEYWMQTDGFIEGTTRTLGISTGHGAWRYRLLDMQFPATIPPQAFVPPKVIAAFDPAPYLHAQRLVDIGGRKLNLYCIGTGSPTVILEAGGGDDMLDWRYVQPLVAKHARVCSYDRAGYGFSDPGPLPRDASAAVGDLHALVANAGIAKPFVLVGYSSGELYARLYADRYLDDLAGLVLVEPAAEGQQEHDMDTAAPELWQNTLLTTELEIKCTTAAKDDALKPGDPLYAACTPAVNAGLPDSLNAMIAQQSRHLGWWASSLSEDGASATTTQSEVRTEQRSYGALPLVVVTAKALLPDGLLPPAENAAAETIVRAGRAPIAGYSSQGSLVQLTACNHGDITTTCAQDVASAIERLIGKP